MADIDFSKYVTPRPPWMAGTDRLSQAISDIWQKRQADEQNRIQAAEQMARQRNYEATAAVNTGDLAERSRHNIAQETYELGRLHRDLTNDQAKYLSDVATALSQGKFAFAESLLANSGMYGIPPAAMASMAARAKAAASATGGGGDEGGAYYDLSPNGPESAASSAGSQAPAPPPMDTGSTLRNPPTLTGPAQPGNVVAPQLVAPDPIAFPKDPNALPGPAVLPRPELLAAPAQPEIPPAPGQPGAVSPYARAPVSAPAQAVPATPQVRPPSALGTPAPPAYTGPVGPTGFPAMPWDTDILQHPIVRGANPNWQQAPTTFPGAPSAQYPTGAGPAQPAGPGPAAGAAPGAVDPATGRQWLQRGFAAPVLPDPEAFRTESARVTRQAMELMRGYAQDSYEISLAQNAAEAVAMASQFMPADEAYKQVSGEYFKALHEHRQDERSNTQATAQANRGQAVEERIQEQNRIQNERLQREAEARAERARLKRETDEKHHQAAIEEARTREFLSQQNTILAHRNIVGDKKAQNVILQLDSLLNSANPVDKEIAKRIGLVLAENKGSTSNEDATASEGLSGRSLEDKWTDMINTYIDGTAPNAINDMRASFAKMRMVLLERTRREYRAHRDSIIRNAPSDYARQQALATLRQEHNNFEWAPGLFWMEDHPEQYPDELPKLPQPVAAPPPPPPAAAPAAPPRPETRKRSKTRGKESTRPRPRKGSLEEEIESMGGIIGGEE